MKIPVETIFDFYLRRVQCHVRAVNYFANLIGHKFPEHDHDKICEPIRTGYAFVSYAKHHHEFKLPPQYDELFHIAHATHHKSATHHIEHYGDVSEISKITLTEMVCDWFSANFEDRQTATPGTRAYASVMEFFNECMAQLPWTDDQRAYIVELINYIDAHMDADAVAAIWETLD